MKLLKFIAYLFYRYYSTGPTSRIPYFSTIGVLVLLCYFHLLQVAMIFDVTYLIPTDGSQMKFSNFLIMGLFMTPFFIGFSLIIRKAELDKMSYTKIKMRRGYFFLILYVIVSFAVVILLALYKKGKF